MNFPPNWDLGDYTIQPRSSGSSISLSDLFDPVGAEELTMNVESYAKFKKFHLENCKKRENPADFPLEEMHRRVVAGMKLEESLLSFTKRADVTAENFAEKIKGSDLCSKDNAINLIWSLHRKLAIADSLYNNGAMKIPSSHGLTGKMLESFLIACAGEDAYNRVSSHLPCTADKGYIQWGIDIESSYLPSNTRHILFAAQPDGSLYLKLETRGWPPLIQKNRTIWRNFAEKTAHAKNYIKTRESIEKLRSLFSEFSDYKLEVRREDTPKWVLNIFNDLIKVFKVHLTKLQLLSDPVTNTLLDKTVDSQITKEGVSAMREHLEKLLHMIKNSTDLLAQKISSDHIYALEYSVELMKSVESRARANMDDPDMLKTSVHGNEVIVMPIGMLHYNPEDLL